MRSDTSMRQVHLATVGRLVAGTQLWFERMADGFFVDQGVSGRTKLSPDGVVLGMGFFLVLQDDGVTLVDTGIGHATPRGMIGSGVDPRRALDVAGASVSDVVRVVLTHLHADHCGGVLGADGAVTFQNAEHVVHAEETAYWASQTTPAGDQATTVVETLRAADVLHVLERTPTTMDGMRLVHTPGHTPGHLSVEILTSMGDVAAVILGDVIHHALQLADPDIGVGADVDPKRALATRRDQLRRLANADVLVGAGHLADTPLFTVETLEGGGYGAIQQGVPL